MIWPEKGFHYETYLSSYEFSRMFIKLPARVEQINRVASFFAQLYNYEQSTFGLSKRSYAQ